MDVEVPTNIILTIGLLLILIATIYHCYIHYITINGRFINNIPGPTVYPIIGNIFQFLGSREEQWKNLITLIDQYNPICKIWLFFVPVVFIRHPDDLQTILKDKNHSERSYDALQPWVGTGLFTSEAVKWKNQRKKIAFTFRYATMSQYVPIMIKHGENMTKSLKHTESTVVGDLISFVAEHTLNILCETLMGVPLEDQLSGFQQRYREAADQMCEIFVYRLLRQWLHNDWIFSLTSKGKEQARVLKILHGFTERIIAEKKLQRKHNHKQTSGQVLENNSAAANDAKTIETQEEEPQTLIDLLIDESEKNGILTDLNIREEVDTFMFGGYDSTSVAISYLLMLLAEHKDIQDRVRNEVDTVMKENGGKLTTESLKNLFYLDRCTKETLRLYPSAFLISRSTGKDVKLQSHLIPAGTILILNIYGVHRDPNFWPNPEIFDPDRFLPGKERKDNAYIPFGSGLRSCIGKQFSLNVMKAIVASLVHHFYLEPIDYLKTMRIQTHMVLHPAHPLRIRFVPICEE